MRRNLELLIDEQSWIDKGQTVPTALSTLNGQTWNVDVRLAMIFTALWTRPPVSTGFNLSDYWAWLRYGRAISSDPNLRLCQEWVTVDPHQKTVLSDELGIGFTTLFLTQKLGCMAFADTLYAVEKLFPHQFIFKSKAKNGQRKSPDYIGIDDVGQFYVLECKGTQTSRKALQKAMERGKQQKSNLSPTSGTRIKYQLVAGLFIPKWLPTSQKPCLMVSDPSWEEIESFFERTSANEIKLAIVQINLAKYFSIAGLSRTAQIFAETPGEQLTNLSEAARQEIFDWLDASEGGVRVLFDSENIPLQTLSVSSRERFQVEFDKTFLIRFVDEDIRSILRDLLGALQNRQREWSFPELRNNDTSVTVETPLGPRFTLEIT